MKKIKTQLNVSESPTNCYQLFLMVACLYIRHGKMEWWNIGKKAEKTLSEWLKAFSSPFSPYSFVPLFQPKLPARVLQLQVGRRPGVRYYCGVRLDI
ncbi:MAG: hypothetical protein JRE65_12045 [Deltaproteobacteria bacterium]|jgi:hypothetical protein|nr:hypothetical protein [Deltaproteobacteria bacterium]